MPAGRCGRTRCACVRANLEVWSSFGHGDRPVRLGYSSWRCASPLIIQADARPPLSYVTYLPYTQAGRWPFNFSSRLTLQAITCTCIGKRVTH